MMGASDYKKQVRKLRLTGWAGLIFFGPVIPLAITEGEAGIMLAGLLMTAASIWVLIRARRVGKANEHYQLQYVPGEGFKRYRRTREQKLRMLTISQWAAVAVLAAALFFGAGSGPVNLFIGLVVFLSIQFYIKPRIKRHLRVDPQTEAELRNAGAIGPDEEIRALYKDFESWNELRADATVLAITSRDLAAFALLPSGSFEAAYVPLNEIRQITVQNIGYSGRRLLLSVGDGGHRIIERHLHGRSRLDSPEEFVSDLLKAADEALLGYGPGPSDSDWRSA
ncbi:hypothetical protein [Saccharibacillus alkalitolerans]|uniref:YokE-like PH domain-containing protein n=1 Tax=Saccharibacillus alkalitolerans TaxID=2705290 RepID=A0ABX0F3X3_9BACL|nr:hypothetical protein [Saccharibacillus alkalitolerans]NGZ75666.1 hypothetical protein [Saccharibacillus alkalitolerans]